MQAEMATDIHAGLTSAERQQLAALQPQIELLQQQFDQAKKTKSQVRRHIVLCHRESSTSCMLCGSGKAATSSPVIIIYKLLHQPWLYLQCVWCSCSAHQGFRYLMAKHHSRLLQACVMLLSPAACRSAAPSGPERGDQTGDATQHKPAQAPAGAQERRQRTRVGHRQVCVYELLVLTARYLRLDTVIVFDVQ